MIRIITKCLGKNEIIERKWDYHFAFFHFDNFENAYLNGKPLKWYHIFKNGDIVEVVKKPKIITTAIVTSVATAVGIGISAGVATGIALGATALLWTGISVAAGMIFNGAAKSGAIGTAAQSTTAAKTYSSQTNPELKGAENTISDDIIPVIFGKTQQTPSYGQLPYRLVGDGNGTNKYRQYFIPNYNNVVYSDFKIGETLFTNYSANFMKMSQASGSSTFIGYDNIKAVNCDEELGYNASDALNQTAVYYYNDPAIAETIDYTGFLLFENVYLPDFTQKNFSIIISCFNNGEQVLLSDSFTINASDLTVIDGKYYYIYQHTFSGEITEIQSTVIFPTAYTRTSYSENFNKQNVLLESQAIKAGSFIANTQVNEGLNYYLGTSSEVLATSPKNTTDIDVIISFPQGFYSTNTQTGDRQYRASNIDIQYKPENGNWLPISSANSLYIRDLNGDKIPLLSSGSSTTVSGSIVTVHTPNDLNQADQLFYRPIGFSVPKGKYTVRVQSADFATKQNNDIGTPYCSEIQFTVDNNILNSNILSKVNQIAFEATAYKGLSGTIKQFNYIAEARIPVWNGTNWETVAKSQNPAAIIRYLLTDNLVNPRAESIDHIDNDTLVELYNWCEEQGYKASGCIGEACKIGDVINEILGNCQALMIPMLNGKHTFVIDKPNKTPIGLFNQHNSWDFKWMPNVGRQTEAIRAAFVNENDYTNDELTLYWYNNASHEEPEAGKTDEDYEIIKKDYKYVFNRDCIKKIVEHELKTAQTKRNLFEFKVNLEGLNMALLDRFYVSNTANMQNESTGLIKSVITENGIIKGFELYSEIEIPENAKIVIRSLDYHDKKTVINIFDVINSGETNIVEVNETFFYNGEIKGAGNIKGIEDEWHYDGDLFSLGNETFYDCTAINIEYNQDNTATITAREY